MCVSSLQVWQCSGQNQVSLLSATPLLPAEVRSVPSCCLLHTVQMGLLSPLLPWLAQLACDTDLWLCLPNQGIWIRFYTRRSQSVNTVASHGMLLFAFTGQTTSDTNRALWVGHHCGAFMHPAGQPMAYQWSLCVQAVGRDALLLGMWKQHCHMRLCLFLCKKLKAHTAEGECDYIWHLKTFKLCLRYAGTRKW